jgi:hypothetical protein
METEPKPLTAKGFVLDVLKEAYFRRARDEKLGSTKRITQELNILQSVIKDFQKTLPNESTDT